MESKRAHNDRAHPFQDRIQSSVCTHTFHMAFDSNENERIDDNVMPDSEVTTSCARNEKEENEAEVRKKKKKKKLTKTGLTKRTIHSHE